MRLYDYFASGNCYKVRLLCALLRVDYERVAVDIFAGETMTDEFAALNPTRRTPVLQTDDGDVIVQSNAILWYLAEGSDYLPADALGRARSVQWLTFEQERVLPGIAAPRFLALTDRAPKDVIEAQTGFAREVLDLLDGHLAGREFVVADAASIADVSLFGYVHVAGDIGLTASDWPSIHAWLDRMKALPGFIDDLEPYPDNAKPGASTSIYDPA